MRIHHLQHVPHEGLAHIEHWARRSGHPLSATHLYRSDTLPALDTFDLLVIMGGPMNIYEDAAYPWLITEKQFIERAIRGGKFVLGICLGAQLIADVLGARVTKNKHREVGWFPVTLSDAAHNSAFFAKVPHEIQVFHWHEDTFGIPPGAQRIASSEACDNQAFEYAGRVVGTQFHFEITMDYVLSWCRESGIKRRGRHVQLPAEMAALTQKYVAKSNACMDLLLNAMEHKIGKRLCR